MTVTSSTNKVSFNGDSSTTVFAYSFKIFDEDLKAIRKDSCRALRSLMKMI